MNFTIEELISSKTAEKWKINNRPLDISHYTNLMRLVVDFLQPLRNYLNLPLIITSGYRVSSVNTFVGGIKNSQHLTGNAVDFYCPKLTVDSLYKAIKTKNLLYDQLIVYRKKGFIHVSLVEKNNRKELIYE